MSKAPIPRNEDQRLRTLWSLMVVRTEAEENFDRLAELARFALKMPVAFVSFITSDEQWFKACVGVSLTCRPREVAYCAHTIYAGKTTIVPDMHLDERFRDDEFVTGPPFVRFYAGAPIIIDGQAVGTFCIASTEPQEMSSEEIGILEMLRDQVQSLLIERRTALASQVAVAIMDKSPDIISIRDHQNQAIYENDRARRLRAIHGGPLVGASPTHKTTIERAKSASETANWAGETVVLDELERAMPVSLIGLSVPVTTGQRVHVFVARDVRKLKEIDRLKSEFVSTVSHELRTPLTSILGALKIVASGTLGAMPEMAMHLINIADNNAERLQRLINDLLDLERMARGHMTLELMRLDVGECVEKTLSSMRLLAEPRQQTIELHCEPLPKVFADPSRLGQVITNLLANALKFSKDGTHVQVDVFQTGDWVRTEVKDQGRGIAERDKYKLFEKFQQVDASDARNQGGTGLGLAISRTIIQELGGEIGVESEPGVGSTFWFQLPVVTF